MKKTLFISIIMLSLTAGGCSDTAFSNDLWDNLTSSKITSDKQITSFTINGYKARISGTSVTSVLPLGTSVTSLAPVITHNGAAVTPESGVAQNFTNPVTYTVTATDGTTDVYTVSVNVLSSADMTNANLSVLKVKKGKLQPNFTSGNLPYLDAPIPFSDSASPAYNDNQSNSLIADPEIQLATITINGNPVENAAEYIIPNLAVGSNNITIVVTAANGTTNNTYSVNMYRAIPIFKTGAGSYSGINPLEDGATQRGVSWPYPRFQDNGNGTVSDLMTGLMWLKDAKMITSQYPFGNAVMEAQYITGFCGYYDWYLPNINEMRSLANYGQIGNEYLSSFFSNCSSTDNWWTSTSFPNNPGLNAYSFDMNANTITTSDKTSTFCVWAVRGNTKVLSKTSQTVMYTSGDDGDLEKGVDWPTPRFHTTTSGTIVDNMTSLMWFPGDDSTSRTWNDSISFIKNTINSDTLGSNFGYNDWSIPNTNQMLTLMNYGESNLNTWLNSNGFSLSSDTIYWTSTSGNITPSNFAIRIDFDNQSQFTFFKSTPYKILPVRLIKPSELINY
jgi:hypothetical protein